VVDKLWELIMTNMFQTGFFHHNIV